MGEIEADNDRLIQHPHQRCVHGAPRRPTGRSCGGESAGTDPINTAWRREGDWGGGLQGLQGIHLLHR